MTSFSSADLALDYVEHEVGPNKFVDNWGRIKKSRDPVHHIKQWLRRTKTPGNAAEIVSILDELASKGTTWLTDFTCRIPPKA